MTRGVRADRRILARLKAGTRQEDQATLQTGIARCPHLETPADKPSRPLNLATLVGGYLRLIAPITAEHHRQAAPHMGHPLGHIWVIAAPAIASDMSAPGSRVPVSPLAPRRR
jgi:hypothetical protein